MEDDDLKSLVEAIKSFESDCQIDVLCADGNERHLDDLKKMERIANAPTNPITNLRISSRSEDESSGARIELKRHSRLNCNISIHGGESKVVALNRRMDELLASSAPWYSFVHGPTFVVFQVVIAIAILGIGLGFPIAGILSGGSFVYPFFPLLAGLLMMPTIWVLELARNRVFPLGVFAINQGAKQHRNNEKWRWTVVVGFPVSLAGSLIVAVLFFPFRPSDSENQNMREKLPIEQRTFVEHTQRVSAFSEGKTELERERFLERDFGKRFRWTGYVREVYKRFDDVVVVIQATRETTFDSQRCYFSTKKEVHALHDLQIGDEVTIDGVMDDHGSLNNCALVDIVPVSSLPSNDAELPDSANK